ncbi:MAG: adenylate/guanylate cyclase domain-containing protein [Dongiaceae bacterium]
MERRLAAVLIADVVGYVRLSQADEEGTRARFQADLREVFEPAIAARHGRLVKTMGDALLVEYRSVVDAVRCAVEIQRLKAERNVAAPQAGRLAYRIGINLGDVIVEGDDIHGDGVNIADRLQELADPGGIAVSGSAYDQLKAVVEVGYVYLGEQAVKHVAQPVRVYRVLLDSASAGKTITTANPRRSTRRWAAAAAALVVVIVAGVLAWQRPWEPEIEPANTERIALPLPDKPSVIVLPFANMSPNADEESFADGMTEDLTTDLSRLSGLFVISRNTAFTYKGKAVKPADVAEELGVRYILEGSVRRSGDEVRINAQLIDAISGGHVWADRYDGPMADIFALQDKVTYAIVDALALRITNAEQATLNQKETSVPAAYEAFLRAWELLRRRTSDDFAKAVPYLEQAVKLDPKYGRAHAAFALMYAVSYDRGWSHSLGISDVEAWQRAKRYLVEAQKYPTALSHQTAGVIWWINSRDDEALAEFKEAITLDSSDALSYAYIGAILIRRGRAAEAIGHLRTAMRLDPHYPPLFIDFLGRAQFALGQFEDAAAAFEETVQLSPDDEYGYLLLAAAYGQLSRTKEAAAAVARHNEINIRRGGIPVTIDYASYMNFIRTADRRRFLDGLRKAGVPEFLFRSEFAEKNRLTADEIRQLFFGNRLRGRSLRSGAERAASVTKDGHAAISGDWGNFADSDLGFDGDQVCFYKRYCGDVFRNPGGTKASENEFIWYNNGRAFTFAQVD